MQLCAMPSGLLNQVALPAKLEWAAGKHKYITLLNVDATTYLTCISQINCLGSFNIAAGKQSMPKLTSHELSNTAKNLLHLNFDKPQAVNTKRLKNAVKSSRNISN